MATKKKLVLHTFPPVPNSYSFTPFGLKVESFLRINKIPYEKIYTSVFGKNRTIPYLRIFDGDQANIRSDDFQEVSDSNEIIAFLLKSPEFDTTLCEENMTPTQKAISHTCLRMLEEHTTQTGFYYRYCVNLPDYLEATQLKYRAFMVDESKVGKIVFGFFSKSIPKNWDKRAIARGLKRYSSTEVVWSMACEDLQALEDLLHSTANDGQYFFGRSHPGIMDCTVFGHLSQFLYIAMDFPQKKYLEANCPCLLKFMEHFKRTHFPDWENLCERKPNEGFRADNPRVIAMSKKLRFMKIGAAAVMGAVVAVAYQKFTKRP